MKGGGGACLPAVCVCVSVAARVPETRFPPSLTLGPSLLALGRSEAEELSASSLDLGVQRRRRRRRRRSEGIREAGPGLRRPRAKRGEGEATTTTRTNPQRREGHGGTRGVEKMEEEESSTNVRGKKKREGGGGGGKGNLEFPVHRRSPSASSFLLSSVAEDTSDYPCLRLSLSSSALLPPPQTLNTHMCTSGSLQSPEAKEEKKSRRGEKEIATNTLGICGELLRLLSVVDRIFGRRMEMVVGVRTWEGGGGGEPAGGRTSVRNRRELTIGEGKVDRQKKGGSNSLRRRL